MTQVNPQNLSLQHRLSAVSNSGSSWVSSMRRDSFSMSSGSSPLQSRLGSPKQGAHNASESKELLTLLAALTKGGPSSSSLKQYALLRDVMQRSIIFWLFEESNDLRNLAQQRLRVLPKEELPELIEQCDEIIQWRQNGIGPAKIGFPTTPLLIAGLVASARVLLGPQGAAAALAVAKENICAQQQVEKRYVTLLLAVAAAMNPSGTPSGFSSLRGYCRPAIDALNMSRSKQYPARLQQLLKKVGRYLTDKRSERLAIFPAHIMSGGTFDDAVILGTPSENQFVHVDPIGMRQQSVSDAPEVPRDAESKQAMTKWWLTKMWNS